MDFMEEFEIHKHAQQDHPELVSAVTKENNSHGLIILQKNGCNTLP